MAIPSTAKIGFSGSGEWTFPEGSVFVKHFELSKTGADGKPLLSTRLETRVLVRDTNGYVYGASYRWRADDGDADLVETGQSANFVVAKGLKGKPDKQQNWFFPGVRIA